MVPTPKRSGLFAPLPTATVALAYLGLALAVTWPLARDPGGTMIEAHKWPGALPEGDVNCFLWAFWWFRQALLDPRMDLLHTPFLAQPGGLSLVTTPIAPLYAALSVPLQRYFSLVALYNGFVFFSLWSTAFFTYLLARETGRDGAGADGPPVGANREAVCASRPAAFVCGCVFGFLPYHIAHVTHLNLLGTQWIPLTLWAVGRALETRRMGWAALAGAGMAAEVYSDWYLAVFLTLLLFAVGLARGTGALARLGDQEERRLRPWFWGIVGAVALAANVRIETAFALPALFVLYGAYILARLIRRHPHRGAHLRSAMVFLVVSGALIAPLYMRLARESREERTVERVNTMAKMIFSAEPWTYLLPPAIVRALDARLPRPPLQGMETPVGGEFAVFPGCVVYGLCAFARWRLWRRGGRARQNHWLAIAAAFAVLSLGPGLKSFGRLVPFATRYDTVILPGVSLSAIPFLTGLRVYARFGLVVELALALWLAANLDRALGWRAVRPGADARLGRGLIRRWGAAVALAAAVLLERFHAPQLVGPVRRPVAFGQLRAHAGKTALGLPLDRAATMMYCQTFHGLPLVNYFGARLPEKTRARFESTMACRLFIAVTRPDLLLPTPPDTGHSASFSRSALIPPALSSGGGPPAPPGVSPVARIPDNATRINAELRSLDADLVLVHRALCPPGTESRFHDLLIDFLGWRQIDITDEYVLYSPTPCVFRFGH